MKKTIVFSFDDARLDTYTNACRILRKFNFPATINVVTHFVDCEETYSNFLSGDNKSMTREQLVECWRNGFEIACHGHTHKNSAEDVCANIAALKSIGIDETAFGFASPNSEVTPRNCADVRNLLKNELSYIRSGIQVRREGLGYAFLTLLERKSHSPFLFRYLNKRNVIERGAEKEVWPSVAITRHTTVRQILSLIDKIQVGQSIILMFHSVLYKTEKGYGADEWFFDADQFENLCLKLSQRSDVVIKTTAEMLKTIK